MQEPKSCNKMNFNVLCLLVQIAIDALALIYSSAGCTWSDIITEHKKLPNKPFLVLNVHITEIREIETRKNREEQNQD